MIDGRLSTVKERPAYRKVPMTSRRANLPVPPRGAAAIPWLRLLAVMSMALGASAPISTYAVRVNADAHGQALIYPYYTARSTAAGNGYATALSIMNSTGGAKVVRVRFIEGKIGAE